ncbi:MAG: ABC transporter substrate-binding protein [Deltaproteobacteria bacterium]|nr:ABC transporter substrate-binding protein [Deltaproteobacteria bacterium]
MKRKWLALMVGFLMVGFLSGVVLAQEKVVVYTSLETDEVAEYLKLARKELPTLDIHIIRLSTGELGARMLAERANPQADLIWGWAVTNLEDFVTKGMLDPYKPKGVEKLEKRFVNPQFNYVGIDMYIAAFCVNTKVMKEKGLPMPKGWNDLLDPKFKGLIAMPNPAASGTGFLQISSILQMYGAKEGKEDGWEFLKKLDKNMGQYIKSGSRPAKMTAAGEFAVGASFDFVVAEQKKQGFPVEFVFPIEGAGYEVEANALLKGAKNLAAAKKFLDWAISEGAMKEYSKFKYGVTLPGIPTRPDLPKLSEIKLYPMDFSWQAKNRDDILKKWETLFLK